MIFAIQALPPVEAVERTDRKSQIAHEQLLVKARSGRIDLYFLGDSITRRWGCSDAQYAPFLEHWKSNFWGWNAGDFGWGGDTTLNILWRVRNGELDVVNPKVIVVLAGTNDLPGLLGRVDAAPLLGRRVAAILAECRSRAPKARIVLTGVFPRTGTVGELVPAVNSELRVVAKASKVTFLDVNKGFTDMPGMFPDGLHPSVAGYQVWADGLRPLLSRWLGKRAEVDLAPAPTGDPGL